MKKLMLILFVSTLFNANAQESETPPIFPGCKFDSNYKLIKCLSEKIQKHIINGFNLNLAEDLVLSGKIDMYISFIIDKNGNISNVKSNTTNPIIKKEIHRVIKNIPKMRPAIIDGKTTDVPFSIPITLQINNE